MAAMERALISVSDKTGVVDFARALAARGVEILSTGGTASMLREAGIAAPLYGPPGTGKNSLVEAAFPDLITVAGDGEAAYFVPGYVATPRDDRVVVAQTEHGSRLPSMVAQGRLLGTQFHPGRSGRAGRRRRAGGQGEGPGGGAGTGEGVAGGGGGPPGRGGVDVGGPERGARVPAGATHGGGGPGSGCSRPGEP